MEESVTYQAIVRKGLAQGAVREARRLLLRLGKIKLGQPDAGTRQALKRITDVTFLEELHERLLVADSWEELFTEPKPRRQDGRRKAGQ